MTRLNVPLRYRLLDSAIRQPGVASRYQIRNPLFWNSQPKCFDVVMALDDTSPHIVKKRLGGIWSVACPRCHVSLGGFMAMSLRGLSIFDEAIARKKQLLEDLNSSCPDHESKLLMTVEDAKDAF
jgi:hypothetical protein